MRKNFLKKDRLAIARIRFYKFILKNYKVLLNYSYFVVILVLLSITSIYFSRRVAGDSVLRVIFSSIVISALALVAVANFLLAYAFALFRERQLKGLKNMIVVDELTRVFNKRYFLSKLHNEIVRSRRYNHILSLIVFDIDRFKKLNDTYGHMCGDFILHAVAQIIKSEVRVVDAVCRYGGEEFVVICPETGVHEAKTMAERIRKQIEFTKFSFHKKEIRVTISGGVNHFDPLKPKSEMTLFSGADKALYVAKNCGRNRIVIYSVLPQELTATLKDVKRKEKRMQGQKRPTTKKKTDKQLSF
ncbi:GGDEF domain-containing protein [Candidatus Omnitrophota bacterium]